MTIEQWLRSKLYGNGLFNDGAIDSVIESTKADENNAGIKWEDSMDDFSPQFRNLLFVVTCRYALKWIDANLPGAFYRSLFVTGGQYVKDSSENPQV